MVCAHYFPPLDASGSSQSAYILLVYTQFPFLKESPEPQMLCDGMEGGDEDQIQHTHTVQWVLQNRPKHSTPKS